MLHMTVLGSGSAGNCALVESETTRLLVDAGFSARQIARRLESAGLTPADLHGILLTHEHSDHTAGLRVLCETHRIPLYCNRPTAECLAGKLPAPEHCRFFATGDAFTVGDLLVESFAVPHDASDPVGFVVQHDDARAGFLTDLGHATELVVQRIRLCQALLLEANHDLDLLQNDKKRPWSLKQRILSRHGHLSNDAAAALVRRILHADLSHLVLAHLSSDCNRPELALRTVQAVIDDLGLSERVRLAAASQDVPTARFSIGARVPPPDAPHRQPNP